MNGPRSHNARRHRDRVTLIGGLADRAELTDLLFRVGACLDEHRFEDLGGLFVEDGVIVTPGGTARGRAELVAQASLTHTEFDRLQHVTSNVLVEVEKREADAETDDAAAGAVGDRARLRADLVGSFGYAADARPARMRGGLCRAQALRTEDGWRFTELEVRPTWIMESATQG